ncbi:MAG: hypothetical protein KBT05_05170, partial [Bacteroidales bacterium]|nr:hypothetical protein [Candidatus Cryptobacteroides caccocaballi]
YWEIGQFISERLRTAKWGAKVVGELSDYIKRHGGSNCAVPNCTNSITPNAEGSLLNIILSYSESLIRRSSSCA